MAHQKPIAGLAGPLVAVTLLAPMLVQGAAAQQADSRVFRGGAEPPSRAVERGVTVVRGQAIVRPATEPTNGPAKQPTRLAAGDSLWLIDEAGARLIACELQETGLAGRQIIECASRDLPDLERD